MNAELMYILWECEVLGGTFYPGAKGTLLNIKTFSQFKIVGKRTLGIGIKIFKPSDKSTADHGKSTWPAVFLVK